MCTGDWAVSSVCASVRVRPCVCVRRAMIDTVNWKGQPMPVFAGDGKTARKL